MDEAKLFTEELTEVAKATHAIDEGYNFGKAGWPLNSCRHPVDSEAYERWRQGWMAAKSENA